jgi:hypothetical protein
LRHRRSKTFSWERLAEPRSAGRGCPDHRAAEPDSVESVTGIVGVEDGFGQIDDFTDLGLRPSPCWSGTAPRLSTSRPCDGKYDCRCEEHIQSARAKRAVSLHEPPERLSETFVWMVTLSSGRLEAHVGTVSVERLVMSSARVGAVGVLPCLLNEECKAVQAAVGTSHPPEVANGPLLRWSRGANSRRGVVPRIIARQGLHPRAPRQCGRRLPDRVDAIPGAIIKIDEHSSLRTKPSSPRFGAAPVRSA